MDNTSLFFQIFINLNGQFWILDQLMIFGATYLIYVVFLIVLFLALKGRINEKKAALLILLGIPIAVLLIKTIHLFYFESRPFVAYNFTPIVSETTDAAFPSRHATISAVIAFSYLYFKSKWSLLFLFLMLWIGLSRIWVGVHYPLDVIGGFLTGIISLCFAIGVKNLIKIYLFR